MQPLKLRATQALARISKTKEQLADLELKHKEALLKGSDVKKIEERIAKCKQALEKDEQTSESLQHEMRSQSEMRNQTKERHQTETPNQNEKGEVVAPQREQRSKQTIPAQGQGERPSARKGEGKAITMSQVQALLDQRDRKWGEVTRALSKTIDSDRQIILDMERLLKSIDPQFEVMETSMSDLVTQKDEIRRLSDRILLAEAQIRELQQKVRDVQDKSGSSQAVTPNWKSDLQSLRRKMDSLRDQQQRFGQILGEPSPYSHGSPSRDGGLNPYATPKHDAAQKQPYEQALSLPWPQGMTLLLREWVEGRHGWGHHEWLELLRRLSDRGYSEFTSSVYHDQIGHFLETHRL